MDMDAKKYAYWLASIKGCTKKKQRKLCSAFGSAKEIYENLSKNKKQILGMGFTDQDLDFMLTAKKTWDLDREWARLKEMQIQFTCLEDTAYPLQIRELPDAPYALFYRGHLPPEGQLRVAIVGARMCSEYGRTMARSLAKELSAQGVAVVSGMARGIDAAGHRGALDSGGETYAVFGCGVDVCYPNYHKQLYQEIMQHGGLLSEYLPGTKPFPGYFPQRNRLISALCDVVLIIEAKQKSGSLITADFALEQGKDIYALPGRVTDTLSQGCNKLIAQGAGMILSVEDFLAELALEAGCKKNLSKTKKIPLEKEELLVYSCLGLLPVGIEEILMKTGLEMRTAGRILASLQQKNRIEEIYKNYYKIIT